MEFSVEFYESGSAKCPVRDFLDELKESNPGDFAAVMTGLARLRSSNYHRPPLSKPIGDDLFELRHVGKLNTRVLYFFMKGRRIILVHGTRKKTRVLPAGDRQVALERKRDWLARDSA
jgi:phage-related protein